MILLELPLSSSSLLGLEWTPVNIGIVVSCILIALLMLIQAILSDDKENIFCLIHISSRCVRISIENSDS